MSRYIKIIELYNVQGHEKLTVNFVQGANVISGVSNVGKSAIFKAFRWVFTNDISTDAIRKTGTEETKVVITYNDGSKVTKIRSKKLNKYILEVDGVEENYESVGVTVPQDIINFTDMDIFTLDKDNKFFLNEAKQGEQFLIEDKFKETVLGKFFDNLTGNGVISTIFKSLNIKILSTNKEIKKLDASLIDKKDSLEITNKNINNIEKTYIDNKETIEEIKIKNSNFNTIKCKKEQLDNLKIKTNNLKLNLSNIKNISLAELNKLKDKIKNSFVIVDKVKYYKNLKTKLNFKKENLKNIVIIEIPKTLIKKVNEFSSLKQKLNKFIIDKKSYNTKKEELKEYSLDINYKGINISIDKLKKLKSYKELIENLKIQKENSIIVESKLKELNVEKENILKELTIKCSKCGNIIKYEELKDLL